MKRAILILSLCMVLSGMALAQSSQPLFLIERTKNVNKLYYEANITKGGEINAREPIRAFWIMWAKDSTGQTTEPLSYIEKKMAYGYNVEQDPSGRHFNMTLKPFKERLIKIVMLNGTARAEMLINGQPSKFEKMYIYSKGDSKPDSIKLYGIEIESGARKYELVIPKK